MVYEEVGSVNCLASCGEALGLGLLLGLLLRLPLRGGGLGLGLLLRLGDGFRGRLLGGGRAAACAALALDLVLLLLGLGHDPGAQRLTGVRRCSPSVSAVATPRPLSGGGGAVRESSSSEMREPTEGRSGMEMDTGGLPVWALAMPPAPTAAMTPTPRTVELRARPPPRCLATRCRPRTGRMDSSVGFHSSSGPSSVR